MAVPGHTVDEYFDCCFVILLFQQAGLSKTVAFSPLDALPFDRKTIINSESQRNHYNHKYLNQGAIIGYQDCVYVLWRYQRSQLGRTYDRETG